MVASGEKWTLLPPFFTDSRESVSSCQPPEKCMTIQRTVDVLLAEAHREISDNLFTVAQKTLLKLK